MKRYIILLLTLLFIFSACLSVNAQSTDFRISTESLTAEQGNTVAVKFSFENNPGIALFTLQLNYDKTKLILKEINGNPLMEGSFITNPEADIVLWTNSGNSTFNGTVFTATFELAQDAPLGKTEVSIILPDEEYSILNYSGDSIYPEIFSGHIDIEMLELSGDVTGDGKVNLLDVARLKRILAKKAESSGSSPDIDNNGDINALDLSLLIGIILKQV